MLARENAYKDPATLQPLLDWVQSRLGEETDPDRLWHLEQRAVGLRGLMGDPAAEQAAFARAEQDPWMPMRCVFDLREGVDAELAGDLAAARALYRRANATGCGSETLSYRLAWLALAAGEHAHAQAILRSLIQNHYGDNFALEPWSLRETVTADLAWMQSCAPRKCWR